MAKKKRGFPPRILRFIASGNSFQDPREPFLGVGDVVRLNSGSPNMLVVDIVPDADGVVVAWREGGDIEECSLSRICLHRVRDAW